MELRRGDSQTLSSYGGDGGEEYEDDTTSIDLEPQGPKPSQRTVHSRAYCCCISKEYYKEYPNLVDSLHIAPRLIIHKKPFFRNSTYGLTLSIRNNGLYPRMIDLTTDSPSDTAIHISQPELHRYLETDEVLHVKINIRSSTSHNINRPRSIFIHSYHPNITFQVPILVLKDLIEPYVTEYIRLPSSVPRDKTYFETIIYNPTNERVNIRFRNSFYGMTLNYLNKDVIVPNDYVKLLVKFEPKKLQEYRGFFNVKVGVSPPRLVVFKYTPSSMSVYVNKGHISFGMTKYGEEIKRAITICNESPHAIEVNSEFYSGTVQNSAESESEEIPKIPNKIVESAISMHSVLLYDFDVDKTDSDLSLSPNAAAHFTMDELRVLEPLSSNTVMITFRPVDTEENNFPEEAIPPYFQRTKIKFCFTDVSECMDTHYLIVDGEISGILLEVFPKTIDFRKIYLGEEHCAFIKILNVDSVNARVKFKDCQEPETCGLRVTPVEGFNLEPCERGIFHLSFFIILPIRFVVTLRFKVDNGSFYYVLIKGVGQHIQLRTFPQLVEFGTVPFAVPQKRFMLLMNPLAVPITLQVTATEDGQEEPLMFNIRDSTEMLPITIRDPIQLLQKANEDMRTDFVLPDSIELSTNEPDLLTVRSMSLNESVYSGQFEEEIMEPIPVLAANLLKNLKRQRIFDKTETDKRVVQEALSSLLNMNYFSIMNKHNNFIFLDWNAIPSDPTELYCDNEIIYLRPNTGRSITILIIPNRLGFFRRSLTVRICPATPVSMSESSEDQQLKTLIPSEFLCSKLWLEYNCCTPEINWDNIVDLTEWTIHAGEEYSFDMDFFNMSNIGGFLHYDVIPNEMGFRDGHWKFYIGSNSHVVAKCLINFRVLGTNKLSGLLRIVGDPHPYPFHLIANVRPTEVRIHPYGVNIRLQVYELHKLHFYIDNYSPTNTILSMKLADIRFQHLTTRGGKLAPTGQSMYTTLVSMFTDPDLYQNTLYIDLQFDNVMEIPISFLVEGVPINFDPEIKDGFDAGVLFTDTKENFDAKIFPHRFPLKMTNRGKRAYRLNITRLTTYNPALKTNACVNQPLTARFDLFPKLLEMRPDSEDFLEIMMTSYEEGLFFCDFVMVVTDLTYPQRKQIIRLTSHATFIECKLSWDCKYLNFKFQSKEPLKERPQMRTAHLINQSELPIEHVMLDAVGPFRIKELYEYAFEKQIHMSFQPFEQKEVFVSLNKSTMKQIFCKLIEGRINVWAINKPHKHLTLRLSVLVPELHIIQPELVLFDRGRPYDFNVGIINQGCTTADFKWKRIEESDKYVGGDNPDDTVAEVLSEILRSLEYNFLCEEETNMTLRYQQCRCQFRREHEHGSLIFDILDEIINDLDLGHRRYHIPMDLTSPSMDESDNHSSTSFVKHTIDHILDRLAIESSQQLSEPSSEYCFSDRFIYFYEKTGRIEKLDSHECVIHLPHVRRFHEIRSYFQLEIIGGHSQYLSVVLVNLAQIIKYLNDNIYLNVRPWYETFNTVVRITNVTKYPLQLLLMGPPDNDRPLIDGYAKLMQDEMMYLDPLATSKIKVSGMLGFSETFLRVFTMQINDTANSFFRLRGQGVLPILNMSTALPKVEQSLAEIIEEYGFMHRIYNYELFKSITETDKEPALNAEEECRQEDHVTTDFSELSVSDEDMPSERQRFHDIQLFKMVQTYVLVNNNQELPNAVVLNQMIVTERYLHRLRYKPELYTIHQKVFNSYDNNNKPQGPRLPTNVRHFTVQPLPCEQLAYVLDLGPLTRDTLRRFELRLHFFGPGKLIAAARTATRIPGLYVDFSVQNHPDKKFTFWAEKCTEPEFFNKCYRNMWERLIDADTDPKLKHAHSFDFDEFVRHQRDITDKDRRMIEEYYNSLNYSVYPDHKHHFTLAKVHTTYHSNFSGVELRMVGYFKPESKYYCLDQRIVDYIYVDLHMGPTMPILLRGVIKA